MLQMSEVCKVMSCCSCCYMLLWPAAIFGVGWDSVLQPKRGALKVAPTDIGIMWRAAGVSYLRRGAEGFVTTLQSNSLKLALSAEATAMRWLPSLDNASGSPIGTEWRWWWRWGWWEDKKYSGTCRAKEWPSNFWEWLLKLKFGSIDAVLILYT